MRVQGKGQMIGEKEMDVANENGPLGKNWWQKNNKVKKKDTTRKDGV